MSGDSYLSTSPSKVLSFLYMGTRKNARDKNFLKSSSIRYIVICTPEISTHREKSCPNYFDKDSNTKYLRIPILDKPTENIIQYLDEVNNFIDQGVALNHHTLIHCRKGISRSASFVIGYLMKHNGWGFDTAFQYLKTKRPSIRPNEGFINQLREYELKLSMLHSTEEKKECNNNLEISCSSSSSISKAYKKRKRIE